MALTPTAPTELEIRLARKLAATLHLNVDERQQLPGGEVRMSAIVAAMDASLKDVPFFPPHVRPGDGFDGVVIERRDDGSLWTHEQHEIAVGRFSPVRVTRAQTLTEAAQLYVRSQGRTEIDGVPIDWGR
jgi:hypothetical protein